MEPNTVEEPVLLTEEVHAPEPVMQEPPPVEQTPTGPCGQCAKALEYRYKHLTTYDSVDKSLPQGHFRRSLMTLEMAEFACNKSGEFNAGAEDNRQWIRQHAITLTGTCPDFENGDIKIHTTREVLE